MLDVLVEKVQGGAYDDIAVLLLGMDGSCFQMPENYFNFFFINFS